MARSRKKAVESAVVKKRGAVLEKAPLPVAVPSDHERRLAEFGDLPKGWKKAKEVFDRVKAVRTIFLDYNRATRVGGHPVRRITTIHGESHGGKTAFALGLLRGFIDAAHLGTYVDAEHATPEEFLIELLSDFSAKPNFWGSRPTSYEETIEAVDSMIAYATARVVKDPSFCAACLVDSINKLQPRRELTAASSKKGAEELAKGHQGRARAGLNQVWLDHLVPRIPKANLAMIFIAQEREKKDAERWEDDFVMKGGNSLFFDASIVARVLKSQPVFEDPSDTKSSIVGFRHKVRIRKSKVSHMDGRFTDCHFYLSNGVLVPAGFDLGRDAIEVGLETGDVSLSGSWVGWKTKSGKRIRKNGKNAAVVFLSKEPEEYAHLFDTISATIDATRAGVQAPGRLEAPMMGDGAGDAADEGEDA